ncbi:hypothetical protein L1887_02964 [Cichorium endivia]|nr:hypothetical protein L1887_02964 [Cichorium endivia]
MDSSVSGLNLNVDSIQKQLDKIKTKLSIAPPPAQAMTIVSSIKEMPQELGIIFQQAKQFSYEHNKVLLKEKLDKVGDD